MKAKHAAGLMAAGTAGAIWGAKRVHKKYAGVEGNASALDPSIETSDDLVAVTPDNRHSKKLSPRARASVVGLAVTAVLTAAVLNIGDPEDSYNSPHATFEDTEVVVVPLVDLEARPVVNGVTASVSLVKREKHIHHPDSGPAYVDPRQRNFYYEATTSFNAVKPPVTCMVVNIAGLAEGSELDPSSTPLEGYTLQLGPVCNGQLSSTTLRGTFLNGGGEHVYYHELDPSVRAKPLPLPEPSRFIARMCIFNADAPTTASTAIGQCNTAYFTESY